MKCKCGKYDGERFKGLICDKCGTEVPHFRNILSTREAIRGNKTGGTVMAKKGKRALITLEVPDEV